LAYEEPNLEDVFCLNFAMSEENYGEIRQVELKPGGANISVNQVIIKHYKEM
jgi:hypothetical protein